MAFLRIVFVEIRVIDAILPVPSTLGTRLYFNNIGIVHFEQVSNAIAGRMREQTILHYPRIVFSFRDYGERALSRTDQSFSRRSQVMRLVNILLIDSIVGSHKFYWPSRIISDSFIYNRLFNLGSHSHHSNISIRLLEIIRCDIPMQFMLQKFKMSLSI